MSFAAGLLGGIAQGKTFTDNKKLRERELSVLEAATGLRKDGGGQDAGMSRGPAQSSEGQTAAPYTGAISDRATHAFNRFVGAGLPDHVAAGLVGNMMQESGAGINPAAVGDDGNAYGSVQWNGPRMKAYQAYADRAGKPYDDFDTQINYMLQEGKTSEKAAWDAISGAKTVEDAARIASDRYWRPGTPMNDQRVAYAQAVLAGRPASEGAQPVTIADTAKSMKSDTNGNGETFRWFRKFFGG